MNPAHKLIPRHFPSTAAIAAHFGISPEAVRLWFRNGIPTLQALEVERVTKGKIKAMEILRFAEKSKAERAAA